MKHLLLITVLLAGLVSNSLGQITPEHTYTGVSAAYIKLPVEGYKYYIMDVANNQCRLYNPDHSLWKTINLSVPVNYYLCDIQFVSENLFNTDNTIELLYVSCIYNSTYQYYTYDTRIVTENGALLLSVLGAGYSAIYPSDNGSKLLLWIYNYGVSPYTVSTSVYSIPGKLSTVSVKNIESVQGSLSQAYPNPAFSEVTIPYSLPPSVNQAYLKLYSMNGALVKSYTVDHTFSSIQVPTAELAAGMYVYRIESEGHKSESFKLSVGK